MSYVLRGDHESFDGLLRRFEKAVQEDQILSINRRNRFYEKPCQARKRKMARKLRKSRQSTRKAMGRRWL